MNPIYKFKLEITTGRQTAARDVFPLYKDDLAKVYEIEQNERFYRAKLDGRIQFVGDDYTAIRNAAFEARFVLVVFISWNGGKAWSEYWRGEFWKTDCKIDEDNRVIEVSPDVVDDYTAVLDGMEKEYDLIKLRPQIEMLSITKRPMVQIYIPGESVVSCFLSGMYWEQDCEAVDDTTALVSTYHFAVIRKVRNVNITGATSPTVVNGNYHGTAPGSSGFVAYNYTKGAYKFDFSFTGVGAAAQMTWAIKRVSNNLTMWRYQYTGTSIPGGGLGTFTLSPVSGTGAAGTVTAEISDIPVYGRYICDVARFNGLDTYPIPSNDIVAYNRNYRRVIGWSFPDSVVFSEVTTQAPTEWGIKQPGVYYVRPYVVGDSDFYPIGRSRWGELSVWFHAPIFDTTFEPLAQKSYILRDANPIASVISVLLKQIAPNITHYGTAEYSQLLYGNTDPISGRRVYLYLTQKSNLLAGDYQQPAQKAPITLQTITDMLRDCFCAYWYIENKKFKIEHVSWFKNGGSYNGTQIISHDLTKEMVTRNGKAWAFETSQYEYEKPTLPERYQFGWMDDVTAPFEGNAIEVNSKFVQGGNIEEISVNNFTSDVDYMLLNPEGCSKDGFALLGAIAQTQYAQMNFTKKGITLQTDAFFILDDKLGIAFRNTSTIAYEYRLLFYKGDNAIIQTIWTDISEERVSNKDVADRVVMQFRRTDRGNIDESAYLLWVGGLSGVTRHVPIVQTDSDKYLQNGFLAFVVLQPIYYVYDLPTYDVEINGQAAMVQGIQRNKRQDIRFPVREDPNPMRLIKTNIGNGQIEKISIPLSSRNAQATLVYDTYTQEEQ